MRRCFVTIFELGQKLVDEKISLSDAILTLHSAIMTKSNGTPLYNNIVFHARARRDLARKATATRRSAGITTQFMKDNDKKKIFPYFNKVFFCRFAWKKFSL